MEMRHRAHIIIYVGSAGQNLEERKKFSSTYVEKRILGGKHTPSVLLRESESGNTKAEVNDIVYKLQPVLKDLSFSENPFPPSVLSTQLQDNLCSHSTLRTLQPCFKLSFSALQTLLLTPDFSLLETECDCPVQPSGKVIPRTLQVLPPALPEGGGATHCGELGNLGWIIHSGMEPLCIAWRQ